MRGNTAEIGREPKTEEVAEESKDNEGLQDHLTVRYTVSREVTHSLYWSEKAIQPCPF